MDKTESSITDEYIVISESSFRKLFYSHEDKHKLYGALYVEMLNRLYVLKHCIEDMLQTEAE